MAVFQGSEDRLRHKRQRAEQAIALALNSRWQEAVELNQQILDQFPKDVDAHNRLGKALMELGRYEEAREAYATALKLDPVNTIASKNLQRLAKLIEEGAEAPPMGSVDPRIFIEESGRTVVTNLVDLAREALAPLTAGDKLQLQVSSKQVFVLDDAGQQIGRLDPKLGQRVIKLLEIGNTYSATVTSTDESHVRVIIREEYRDPSMGSRPSFPSTGTVEAFRSYTRPDLLRSDMEDDDLEDDEAGEREDADPDAEGVAEPELGMEETTADDTDLNGEQD